MDNELEFANQMLAEAYEMIFNAINFDGYGYEYVTLLNNIEYHLDKHGWRKDSITGATWIDPENN